jgi:molecular chaperone GrpE
MNVQKTASKAKTTKRDTVPSSQLREYRQEIKKLKQELQEKQDKLLRAYADNQNLWKRMEKNQEQRDADIQRRYLLELLDIKELLQNVLDDPSPKEGIKAIIHSLDIFFDKEHIAPIECVGKPFNHNCHYALSTIEKEGCNEGDIVEEVKKGYFVSDKVLRPSHVIVAQKKIQNNQEEK